MQLALRRTYGYAFPPYWGIRGLGDDTTTLDLTNLPITVTNTDPVPTDSDPLLTDESGNFCLASMFVNGQCPQSAQVSALQACAADPNCSLPPTANLPGVIPFGQSGGQMTGALPTPAQLAAGTASSFTPAQLAAAIKAGSLIAATVATPGRAACPSGVAYPNGQCMPVSSGILGGTPLVAGVSNTTLGIVAVVFVALMLMGKKR